ncbi:methylmalonic aciduria and homocystinuria type D homolog, mitochondrial [Prorops nasuta]|uniref:methylmalonic aciduria and homocystinuria type D homolog, mitochondrial n=1 Tax=Prorops nasuta TaxID=863751 RepID=UPI0034CF2F82
MMICGKLIKKHGVWSLYNLILKAKYSRRSDKNIYTYKILKANNETLDDIDNTVFGTNSNWELLTPRGFRFYLPGSIGLGWLDITSTAQMKTQYISVERADSNEYTEEPLNRGYGIHSEKFYDPCKMLYFVAKECPLLLRKSLQELFPLCLEVNSPQLTVVTISQKINKKTMKWRTEIETEKLAKYFLLAALDICSKLKMLGYWADFINPFSGQPYFSPHKNNSLYQTDERFRCLGFKIENRNNCKIITCENTRQNFMGSLFTTAPPSTEFLKEIMSEQSNEVNSV